MSQFQLFPPPSPEVKAANNPFRRVKKPDPKAESDPISPNEIKDSTTNTESLLLQIIEDTHDLPPPPPLPAYLARTKSASIEDPPSKSKSSQSARSRSRQGNNNSQRYLPSQSSSGSSSSSFHTAISSASPQSSHSSATSPVPMKSIFPQLDPNVPLNKQSYHSQLSSDGLPTKASRKPRLTLSPPSNIDQYLGPKTVPASIVNFPTGVMEPDEIRYSSNQELELLWEAANGQRPRNIDGTFNLRLTKTGLSTFTFGNSQKPFYTLQTYSNNEISISRGLPSKPNHDVPIMTLSLEDRRRREHPHDGLVALLFSRLAAMLAIEQAEEISKYHHLSGTHASEIESNALKRAASQESCRLTWNRNLRLYEFRHPSQSKRLPPPLVGAAGIPLSPVQSQSSGLLHITVSASSSDATPYQPPTIIVTGPMSSTAMEAAQQAANPRTSTMPVTDQDEPLAVLDFGTRTLSISPAAVIATIPSLYAVDSLVAAVLAVAVSDEATNPILADMELGSPKSAGPTAASVAGSGAAMPYRGDLITTFAEREDYKQSLELASQIEAAAPSNSSKRKSLLKFWERGRSADGRESKSKSKKKKKQIVVEEFDLEKYGRYGPSSSREGEKVPGITRGLIKILFLGLDILVKGLTLLVKILAWLLVNSTRCFTSDKF